MDDFRGGDQYARDFRRMNNIEDGTKLFCDRYLEVDNNEYFFLEATAELLETITLEEEVNVCNRLKISKNDIFVSYCLIKTTVKTTYNVRNSSSNLDRLMKYTPQNTITDFENLVRQEFGPYHFATIKTASCFDDSNETEIYQEVEYVTCIKFSKR